MATRFVVYGAGAVGGVVGARLSEHGHDVVLIARGAHHDAIRDGGLRVDSPDGTVTVAVPVVDHPARLTLGSDDVVLLAMKGQDTAGALHDLALVAPPDTPVVCLQNGVVNERRALRLFPDVYGVCVMCPTGFLEPGVVQAWSTPMTGSLDVGRYPTGTDDVSALVAAAFEASTFRSVDRPDVMRWKYGKLLMNLVNAAEAAFGPTARQGDLAARVRAEGEACLAAAGIEVPSADEERAHRRGVVQVGKIEGRDRDGGSSWQSLARGTGSVEADDLNGEIVLLGRLHGVPTPLNEALQRLARRMAAEGAPPGSADPSVLDGVAAP